MPSSAVDAFIYVWKIFAQYWAKTNLAREWNVNSWILILLKLFLSMLWPRTSCSNKLGSQGESSEEKTNIAMCCSRWCHLCHRFAVFLFAKTCKNYKIEEPWLEQPWRTRCFLRFEHLGLFLDVLGFACLNYVKKKSDLPCLHSNCQPLAWKRPLYDYENNTKWSLLFTFRFWYLLTVFGL